MRYEEYLSKWAREYEEKGLSDGSSLPEMDLYLDQMVSTLNEELSLYAGEEGGPLTKSIVSNYAKHHMIPKPDGKRYSRSHMVFLLSAFYLKGGFSMEQIERLMTPLIQSYGSQWDDDADIPAMYKEVIDFVKSSEEDFAERMDRRVQDIKQFLAEKEQDDDLSELYMIIMSMIYRSNAERFLAEKLLDEYFPNPKDKSAKKKK